VVGVKQSVPISGVVLEWAREQDGLTRGELAEAVGSDPGEVAKWETGQSRPSRGEFTKLAKVLRRPSAVFFLPSPPQEAALPKSFRSVPGLAGHALDQGEVRDVRWSRRLQDVARWLLEASQAPAVELAAARVSDSVETLASTVRAELGVSVAEQLAFPSANTAFRVWRQALEARGILVVQLSLGKKAVRGFSVWDDRAPLVAVNTTYHPTARVFTLFHEVGHLVLRSDSTCFGFVGDDEHAPRIERWCETFAAKLLLPGSDVERVARVAYGLTPETTDLASLDTARLLANRFSVSTRAMALRLQELALAPPGFYGRVSASLDLADWNNRAGSGRGQTRIEKRLGQLGGRIPQLLIAGEDRGRLNRADVADYLKLTAGQVDDLRGLVGLD
jgi:Zn-dependent peptidase ImmA (M78 family)/transcriptional regulator with XRE-family HTH domain